MSKRKEDYGTIYIRNVDQAKLTTQEKAVHVIMQEIKYHPAAIGLEEETHQRYLGDHIRHVATQMGCYPTIAPLKTHGKDKGARALSIQGLVQSGRVKFALGKYPAFINQLLSFTPRKKQSRHDDMVDAFVWLLKLVHQRYLPKDPIPDLPPDMPELSKIQLYLGKFQETEKRKTQIHPITGMPI